MKFLVLILLMSFLSQGAFGAESFTLEDNCENLTPLMQASESGSIDLVTHIIEHQRHNINEQNSDGTTALMLAAASGHLNVVIYLVQNGADTSKQDIDEWTAKDMAQKYNKQNIVDYLNQEEEESKTDD